MKLLASVLVFLFSMVAAVPAPADMRSKYVRIEFGGAVADDAGGFQLIQIIANNEQRPLWLMVRQGEGPSGCEVTEKIEALKKATFQCKVAELKPGDLPVVISIFTDQERTQTLETLSDRMHFSRGDIRTMLEFAKAQRLPVTYEGLIGADKPTVGALLRGFIPHASGTLQISSESVDFADGKKSVNIPVGSIRKVAVVEMARNMPPWIVVTYEITGVVKQIGFQDLSHPEDVRNIVNSLQAAAAHGDEAEKVAGETLGDRGLQRDTRRTILLSEKDLAPACASPKIVDTKIETPLANAAVEGSRPVGGDWAERWTIDRCGTRVDYRVRYSTDPAGGTKIAVDRP